jgi:hypothetical protein
MKPYWPLHAFGKTPNISHATTTGLESAGEKWLNPTVPELIENLPPIQERPTVDIRRHTRDISTRDSVKFVLTPESFCDESVGWRFQLEGEAQKTTEREYGREIHQ